MKRTLTFEFEADESENFETVVNAEKVKYVVEEFDRWLRHKIKYGFDLPELKGVEGLTSEEVMYRTMEMARDRLWECLNEKV